MTDKRLGVADYQYSDVNRERGLITRVSLVKKDHSLNSLAIPCCEMPPMPGDSIPDSDGAAYRKRL